MHILTDTREQEPFPFAGERYAWSFLRQYLEGARRRLKAVVKAHGED